MPVVSSATVVAKPVEEIVITPVLPLCQVTRVEMFVVEPSE